MHNVFECVVGVLSIVFNIWLLYLIKNHSKFGSNFYRVMLAIDALLDLTLATFVFLGQPASVHELLHAASDFAITNSYPSQSVRRAVLNVELLNLIIGGSRLMPVRFSRVAKGPRRTRLSVVHTP